MGIIVKPYSGMIISEDVTFEPGEYTFTDGRGIIVAGNGISINGNGAIIRGRGKEGKKFSYSGIGLFASGFNNVTVKDLTMSGFQVGMKIMNGMNWTIMGNDLTGNYTDPDFGWGDGEAYGALYLEGVSHSLITGNKGNNVWNGLNLKYSDNNVVTENEMSHCTNVCLKLWGSSNNDISNNVMNYGIRISPGEVHARDSSSVLIENGSNDNKFMFNNFTHGGDGVFIRSLNGWVSRRNYFEGNDASYSHNNAWEVWDPDNTFVNNKGNYSSYGFWLGGSCHAVLIGNEAAYNGTRISNAPEPFGNAGIAVVNGSSSHFVMRNNQIHHNKSAGLAIGFKEGYESYHWIIEQNVITNNDTYGIYLKHANWINITGNVIENNRLGDVHQDVNVSGVVYSPSTTVSTMLPPKANARLVTSYPAAGQLVQFEASGSESSNGRELSFRWEMGDGSVMDEADVSHTYALPGFFRASLTVSDGELSDLAWFDLYVVPNPASVLLALASETAKVVVEPNGKFASLQLDDSLYVQNAPSIQLESINTLTHIDYPIQEGAKLAQANKLGFWMKYQHEMSNGFGHGQIIIKLVQDDDNYIQYVSNHPYYNWSKIASEARYGWSYFELPVGGSEFNPAKDAWQTSTVGAPKMERLERVSFAYSSHGGYFSLWLDEVAFINY
ncbi:right-handed parallel beta-helix repeat-containing protein [Paenibacillus sp. BC26]|uniref:right-handed parallel beta-helix repeat-containing protein n=1 Tax=Paenibacillus sp. BC26 TaxID=1881032 RepID=UPI0008E3F6F4|nr:right-handed parallel beta-helix repeat-containing protein [Paenibacillus sp. BC26]SFS50110.1 parallel beta-helix repeat (two copies) [Paenibacillus sp. BC26]